MQASALDSPQLLIVDPEWISEIATVFETAGFWLQTVSEVAAIARAHRPDAILLRADLGSAVFRDLSRVCRDTPGFEAVPIVLLTTDARDAGLASRFRGGLVELLAEPFDPDTHPAHVARVIAAAGSRWGAFTPSVGLARFLEHVRDAQRTGEVIVARDGQELGRASFVRGVLRSAQSGTEIGAAAVSSLRRSEGSFRFVELRPGAAEGPIVLAAQSRVLVVDDDPELRDVLSTLLTQSGFEVTCAEDGQRGCDLALLRSIDLVLADLHMPTFDGWGMLRALGSDVRTREIPVAVLSGHDRYREVLRAKGAGARLYLAKGPRLDTLPRELATMLAPRRHLLSTVGLIAKTPVAVESVGAQWVLRAIAEVGASGTLDASDRLARFTLGFHGGRLVHARATIDEREVEGSRAVNAFIASRDATGEFVTGVCPDEQNVTGSLEEQLAHAQHVLNICLAAANEVRLVNGASVRVDPELYALYSQLCPPGARETVRQVCEQRLTPREAIARSNRSPIEVEATFQDLVRREVISVVADASESVSSA